MFTGSVSTKGCMKCVTLPDSWLAGLSHTDSTDWKWESLGVEPLTRFSKGGGLTRTGSSFLEGVDGKEGDFFWKGGRSSFT